jgi:hypothetical protein
MDKRSRDVRRLETQATAVHNAAVALDPSASQFPGHSTDAEAARP